MVGMKYSKKTPGGRFTSRPEGRPYTMFGNDTAAVGLPPEFLSKWQKIVDLLAEILDVPAALIMKVDNGYMQVYVSSKSEGNPYKAGEKEKWDDLYCQAVIQSQEPLIIADARADDFWKNNPDIELGMIAYMGFPINFPDGTPFGTLCVLDRKERNFSKTRQKLLIEFKETIESDLRAVENERFLEETGEMAKVGGWQLDVSTGMVLWTKQTFRIHEVPFGKMPSLDDALEFWHPEDRPILSRAIERAVDHGEPYDLELRFITAKGRNLYARTICKPTVVQGKTVRLQGTFQDITERKLAENEFESIFEMSLALICVADLKTAEFIRINPAFVRTLGYEKSDLLGRSFLEFIHPDDIEPTRRIVEDRLRNGEKVITFENRYRHRDGSYRNLMWNSHPKVELGVTYAVAFDVTERRKTEKALWENERCLRHAQTIAGIGSWRFDLNTKMVSASEQSRRIYGLSGTEWSIQEVQTVPLPKYRKMLDDRLRGLIDENTPYEVEFEIRRPSDGKIRNIHSIAEYDRERNLVIGTMQDITERKEAIEARMQSERRFRSFVENARDIVYSLSPDGLFTYVSPNWMEFTGVPSEQMIGASFEPFVHPEDVPICHEFLKRVLTTGRKQTSPEYRTRHHDGSWRWYVSNGSPMKDGEGRIVGYMGIARDVTERKLSEETICAERERLLVTLRSIGDGVITTDTAGRIVIINNVAEELTGWTQEEALGRPLETVFRIIHEFTRKPCDDPVRKVLATGRIIELANHTVLIARDGTERIIADSGAPIKDKANRTIGVVLVFRDMTEKQKLLDTIQRTTKLDSLGVLAGGIAHDFNNLLGGIFGYIDLASEVSGNKRVTGYLAKALGTIDRARSLTQQLLTFAKGGAPVKNTGRLFPFIEETAEFALSGSAVRCKTRISPDLWACEFDKNQIGQAIDNIVINAQQAMPDGGVVEIVAENVLIDKAMGLPLEPGRYVEISIKDRGIGMPREIIHKIFDPFYTTKEKGHGLGLATSYSILSKHGGHIDVESEPGKGTAFHLFLPASEGMEEEQEVFVTTPFLGSGTVLVMDDEPVIRDIICEMLNSLGYTAKAARNGREAISFLEAELGSGKKPAAMIFDLTIPGGMGGKETIGEVRKICADIPVFVSSGYADDPIMACPRDYGFSASICKPFKRANLVEMLRKHLASN